MGVEQELEINGHKLVTNTTVKNKKCKVCRIVIGKEDTERIVMCKNFGCKFSRVHEKCAENIEELCKPKRRKSGILFRQSMVLSRSDKTGSPSSSQKVSIKRSDLSSESITASQTDQQEILQMPQTPRVTIQGKLN